MASSSTLLKRIPVQGVTHLTYQIDFTSTTTSEEHGIELGEGPWTLTNFMIVLTPSSASTVDPALGVVSGWTVDAEGHVAELLSEETPPAAYLSFVQNVPFYTYDDGNLYVRPRPDASGDSITVYLTVVEGHVV